MAIARAGVGEDGLAMRASCSAVSARLASDARRAWPSGGAMPKRRRDDPDAESGIRCPRPQAARRRRLSDVIATPGVSGKALVRIAKKLAEPGHAQEVTLHAVLSTIEGVFDDVGTTIELPMQDNKPPFAWKLARIDKLLQYVCKASPVYSELLTVVANRVRGAPLSLVLYMDEVTPGDALALRHDRKFWMVFFTFLEFGADMLWREELWLPLGCLRHGVSVRVDGGISCATRLLLREMFFGPSMLAGAGAPVALANGTSMLVRARLSKLLADMDAFKGILCLRGANGWKPCLRCKNVILKGGSVDGDGGYFVDICCHEHARFEGHSDADVWKLWDDLAAAAATAGQPGHMKKGNFKKLDKASGFNYHPKGLLEDKELRAVVKPSAMTYDSMHNLWSNGTVGWEVFGFVKACQRKADIGWPELHRFTRRWQFPSSHGRTAKQMFTPGHETACKKSFKAGASELISIFSVLLAFAEERAVRIASLEREMASLRACGLLADAFLKVKRGRAPPRSDFIAAAEVHLNLHKQAYGTKYVKPKHHYVFHNAEQEPKELDCFVTERHNKMAKAVAEPVENTARMEATTLAGCVLQQVRQLEEMGPTGNSLVGARAESDELRSAVGAADVSVARALRWEGNAYNMGQVVRSRGGEVFIIDACAEISGELHVVARGIEISTGACGLSIGSVVNEFLVIKMSDADLDGAVWAWRVKSNGDYVIAHAR